MTLQLPKQLPISLRKVAKRDVRTQFGALVFRKKNDKVKVLLITSRGTGRWIIPKGWPQHGAKPASAAATEAWEEAGVRGRTYDQCLGIYAYRKKVDPKTLLPVLVMVYPVKMKELLDDFPEAGQRRRKWFSLKKAAKKVDEPELAQILKSFDPKMLR